MDEPEGDDDPFVLSLATRRALRVIAAVGVVVALVGTVVVWQFLGDLDRNADASLVIGEQAADALVQTVDVADDVVAALDDGLATLETTLDTLSSLVASTADVAESTSSVANELPERIADIDAGFARVESIGASIDSVLAGLANLPFGLDYSPDTSFADSIGQVRSAFEPLEQDLTSIATELSAFAEGSVDLGTQLSTLADDVAGTREVLEGTDALLDSYRTTAEAAGDLAASSRLELTDSMQATRWVVVAVGVLIALGQFVPWTLAGLRRRPLDGDPLRVT